VGARAERESIGRPEGVLSSNLSTMRRSIFLATFSFAARSLSLSLVLWVYQLKSLASSSSLRSYRGPVGSISSPSSLFPLSFLYTLSRCIARALSASHLVGFCHPTPRKGRQLRPQARTLIESASTGPIRSSP